MIRNLRGPGKSRKFMCEPMVVTAFSQLHLSSCVPLHRKPCTTALLHECDPAVAGEKCTVFVDASITPEPQPCDWGS